MYVCNCNGISEREVDVAIRAGAKRWDDIHAYFNCRPGCGKCEHDISGAILENSKTLLLRLKTYF